MVEIPDNVLSNLNNNIYLFAYHSLISSLVPSQMCMIRGCVESLLNRILFYFYFA